MRGNKNLSQNLKLIREQRNISLTEFSKEIGIPKSTLQSILKDGNTTLDTAIRISEGLGIPLDALLRDEYFTDDFRIVQWLLKGIAWYSELSPEGQREALLLINKLLEVLQK